MFWDRGRDATDYYISGFAAGIDDLVAHEGVRCVCGGGFFANLKNEATGRGESTR
jgi:hypothetical protein